MVNVTAIDIARPSSIRLERRICRLEELCLARGPASIGAASIGGVVADSMKRYSCSLDKSLVGPRPHWNSQTLTTNRRQGLHILVTFLLGHCAPVGNIDHR